MRAMRERNFSKRKIAGWSIILCVALIVGVCCMICPWLDDDLTYQYNLRWFDETTFIPIRTIGDIFESQYYHYLFTNGRYVAHWLVQLYDGILGKTAFAVSNTIIYILFIRMIMITCGIKTSNWKGVLTTACLVLTCQCVRMTPAFQMYIWMYLLVLCFIWVMLHYRTDKWWMTIILCLFSFICGNAHESVNPAVCVGFFIYFALNFRKTSLQQWLMLIFFSLGLLTILLSPGTQTRIDMYSLPLDYRILALYHLKNAIPAFYILIAIILYKVIIRKESLYQMIKAEMIWWLFWATSIAIILYFGFSGGRAILGEELFSLILILKLLKKKSFTPFWLALLSVATIVFLYCQIYRVSETNRYLDEIKRQALANDDGNIYIDFTYSEPIGGFEVYCGKFLNVNYKGIWYENRMMNLISHHFTKEWGVNHSIRFYPTSFRPYIEGKVDTTSGNMIARITKDSYLIVMNKKHPADFYISYERDIPFLKRKYAPEKLDYLIEMYDSDQWLASVVTEQYYDEFYPATFSMKTKE